MQNPLTKPNDWIETILLTFIVDIDLTEYDLVHSNTICKEIQLTYYYKVILLKNIA